MGRYVNFYVDVNEFSQYKDKWARASKWMKERFGIDRKTCYSFRKDADRYLKVELWENDNGKLESNYYWSKCTNTSEDYANRMMATFPQEHRRIYYKADRINIGEL